MLSHKPKAAQSPIVLQNAEGSPNQSGPNVAIQSAALQPPSQLLSVGWLIQFVSNVLK